MNESVSKYLDQTLVVCGANVGEGARPARRNEDVGSIESLLFRKGYRRRVTEERRRTITGKVKRAIAEKRPLGFVVPFGGYKHYWNESAPLPDWAEVFHLDHMVRYLAPVARLLPAGVLLEYVSEDFLVSQMDNYEPETLDAYAEGFRTLLGRYQPFLPPGLQIEYWRLSERFDTSTILADIFDLLPVQLDRFRELPTDTRSLELVRSRRSVKWSGLQDLSDLDTAGREERIVLARVMEKTFSEFGFTPERIGGYYEEDLRSCIVFSWGLSLDNATKAFLTLHSAPGSVVDHWIGRGIIQRRADGSFRHTIVSRSQYEQIRGQVDETAVGTPLGNLPNLGTVDVARKRTPIA